jgi:hypothetical protein
MNPATLQLRIVQISFIISVGLFYYVLSMIQPAAHAVNSSMQSAIVLCAIVSAYSGFWLQQRFLRIRSQSLPTESKSTPLSRWFAGHILRFATAESVALYGVVLHMFGSSSTLVNVMFICSLLLLLIWQPGTCHPKMSRKSL